MPLLVVGSIALDTIRTPDGKEYEDVLGGSCTYFSVAASHLTKVQVVGVVGEDFPKRHITMLEKHGINLDGLEIKKGKETFRWAGTYSEDMNDRTTDDLQFGVLGEFDPVLPKTYTSTKYVFLACAQPALQLKVIDQMKGKPFVVADTIEFYIENDRKDLLKVLKRCNGLIVNETEARMLTGDHSLVKSAADLRKLGPKFVVVKKGEHGGILATKDGLFPVPAYPLLRVKDPTGAGDSFAGGFMGYLAKAGKTNTAALRRAVVYGTALASFTCEGISLRKIGKISSADVTKRVNGFKKLLQIP